VSSRGGELAFFSFRVYHSGCSYLLATCLMECRGGHGPPGKERKPLQVRGPPFFLLSCDFQADF
jgi:hypothetical protein